MSLPTLPYPAPGADPECFAAAARYVQREYGDTGYRMALEGCGGHFAAFRVRHADGSEFRVLSDAYGNAWTLPYRDELADAMRAHNHLQAVAAVQSERVER